MHRNARLKVSPGTKPCVKCGKGTKNKYMMCHGRGYHCAFNKEWIRNDRILKHEFLRLACKEYEYTFYYIILCYKYVA